MLKPKTFLLAIACLCSLINVHAATYDVQIGDLRYSVDTGTMEAAVFASNTDISGDVVIPASIEADPDGVMRTYTVTYIGQSAFSGCSSLASITIPNSVTFIGFRAFYGCSALTSVTIPDFVFSIGGHAFRNCTSLTTVTIPNSVTFIEDYTFSSCTTLASVTIPESVTSIGNNAFSGCTSLASVAIPNSVTSIGDYTFSSCTALASVTLPELLSSIGRLAFNKCTSLASITIPNSVISVGVGAFRDCTYLKKIYCMWDTPITCVQSVWDDANYSNATLYVPEGCIPAYQAATPWSSFLSIEEYSISGIEPTTVVNEAKTIVGIYDINGRKVNELVDGINIIRYSDGTTRKVVVRNPQ